MKEILKAVVAKTPYIVLNRRSRRGISLAEDLRSLLQDPVSPTIFDVGANEGQTAMLFHGLFPQGDIFCFEPVGGTFQQLTENIKACKRVKCYSIALGDNVGSAVIHRQPASTWNSLAPKVNCESSEGCERIEVSTVDEFCSQNGLLKVDILKTDTEGFDDAVLRGAQRMISSNAVDLIFTEVGVRAGDARHTPLGTLLPFLQQNKYYLFSLYNSPPRICPVESEFFDALFVSERLKHKLAGA